MDIRSTLGVLIAAMAAVLAFASPAMAKGGTGGGGGGGVPCADLGAPTTTPPARTLTVDVTRADGSVQDSRTTTLAASCRRPWPRRQPPTCSR